MARESLVIQPFWETVSAEKILLTVKINGIALDGPSPAHIADFNGGRIGFEVELKGKPLVERAVVACSQSKHWGSMQARLTQRSDGIFVGELEVAEGGWSAKETWLFEVLLYGRNPEDPRPIGRSAFFSITKHKADAIKKTSWSSLPQRFADFSDPKYVETNPELYRAKSHMWRLVFENSQVVIYWNTSGERQEQINLLKAKQADPSKESIRSLLNALVAKSAMAVQHSWDMLSATDLTSTDGVDYAEVPMIKGLKLASQVGDGPADLERLGRVLCEVEFKDRARQKMLSKQIELSLRLLAVVE
jgi:hypothetical protein